MYSINDYGAMMADTARADAYVEALRRTVRPGDVVIDLGAGAGLFALLACRFGARKVYAIEPDAVIHVARQVAEANGLADRIAFIQDVSTNVELPEPAQVIVADLRGKLPLYDHHLVSLADARRRLLAPDGVLIPRRDELWAAVVSAPELHAPFISPWETHNHGFALDAARRLTVNSWQGARVAPDQMLVAPQRWAEIDYWKLESYDRAGTLVWPIAQAGTGHGVIVWFDALLCDRVGFSNAPGGGATVYGSAFFPWPQAVALSEGDQVTVALQAKLVGDDYVWSWRTQVVAACGQERAAFQQSTFFGAIPSPDTLRKFSDAFVPALSEGGAVARYTLSLIDGQRTQGEIADLLCAQFPQQFSSRRAALDLVAALSQRYSR